MSSATINRPSGTAPSAVRSNRFGEFNTTVGRPNPDDKLSQGSTIGQGFGSTTWQASAGIWGNSPLGTGFSNGKRDPSRSRVSDDDGFQGTTGSGALAASSEAMSWGTWNVDKTSPTMSTSGNTSPVRHRSSAPMIHTDTPPYVTAPRASLGSGLTSSRLPSKSNLDPLSGPFKYPFPKSPYAFSDEKEITGQSIDSYILERAYRQSGSSSREDSGPPSRHSETGSNGTTNGSFFSNAQYAAGLGHTPNNSLQMQRPASQRRAPSFPSSSGLSYADLINETADTDSSLNRHREAHNAYLDSAIEPPYSSPASFANHSSQQSQNGSSSLWPNGFSMSTKASNGFVPENHTDGAFFEQLGPSKSARFSDRGSASPGNEFRRQPNSPSFFVVNDTASNEAEPPYLRGIRTSSVADLERGFQRIPFPTLPPYFAHHPQVMYSSQLPSQYHNYDYPPQQNFRQQYGYQIPAPPYASSVIIPRGPARDLEDGIGIRSGLLEEFRYNSKSNRRYELKDIYNHVVEFSGDQHGSRFIQQKLETANSDEKEQIFREIQPNALQLMTDVFGNYVIQKLFEHGNQVQKKLLAEQMKNHVNELSVQMYGCRVVQKALEHVLADQQAELVKELQNDILKCVKDQNGNHVIQKAIERVPTEHIQFIIEAFRGQVHTLATHPYGCRVIQRMLEYCSEKDQAAVLDELHSCAAMLITDQYGNYVMQHVITHGKPEDRAKIISIVTSQLLALSKHKFASNVVEKTIQFGSDEQRRGIVERLTAVQGDGNSPLQLMMKDQYGNYVIQKLLGQLKGAERERFVEDLKPQLMALKKFNYGKQITAIEKLISTGPASSSSSSYPATAKAEPSTVTDTLPLDISSTAATPMLTMEQNSPESSSVPSTNASTVDGPTQPVSVKVGLVEKAMPELKIESVP